jgi:hypothetical protein
VDTRAGRWKDAGEGKGIIPIKQDMGDDDASDDGYVSEAGSSSLYSAGSGLQDDAAVRSNDDQSWLKRKKKAVTPGGIKADLMKKTIR